MIPVLNFDKLTRAKHVGIDQIEAMRDYSLSESVVATFVALYNIHHQLHHIILYRLLLLAHPINLLHTALNLPHYEFASISIDQDHPFVDEEFFSLKFDLYSFEHFDGLNDDWES